MKWTTKAAIARTVAAFPPGLAAPLYYGIQKHFGGLTAVTRPQERFPAAVWAAAALDKTGRSLRNAVCLEIGTGYSLTIAIGFWLCGARRVITIDTNRHLKTDIAARGVRGFRLHRSAIDAAAGPVRQEALYRERYDHLLSLNDSLDRVFAELPIEYHCPADATALALDAGSIDVHYSNSVLEHIPPEDIPAWWTEARRVLAPKGVLAHRIALGDHFAHSDPNISSINFLRFDAAEWRRIAGNRFMYHNRLRASDFSRILDEARLDILLTESHVDPRAVDALANGLPLAEEFRSYDREDLCVSSLHVVGAFHETHA